MRTIQLTQGQSTFVSDADFAWLSKYRWFAHKGGNKGKRVFYAVTNMVVNGKRTSVKMHRIIIGAGPHQECDHKDGDTLNNTRRNLRIATRKENCQNRAAYSTSGYKGVYWNARLGKFISQIRVNGLKQHLGVYMNQIDAAKAYNMAARKHFGQFAKLNEV